MEQTKNDRIKKISIANRLIGEGEPSFIIAEIGQSHDGSLGTAHAYIDAVAETGADAVKFQTHIAMEESTLDEPFRIKFSKQDQTRYDYWKRMEFSKDQWAELAAHAREKNLIFISTPFSVKAIEILKDIGMPAWKISSGEVKSDEMLEAMTINRSPMLLSTGMSDFSEIEMTVSRINEKKIPYAIFQCTTKYPCALEDVGLNVIHDLREKFRCPTGLSDHSGTVFPGIAAIAQGADLLEVHVIFDRKMFGPDVISSITIEELKFMVEARNAFFKMFTNPVDKNIMAEELTGVKSLFSKSIASRMFLPKGTILKESMLTLKKPGTGIPGHEINNIKGRRLKKDVSPERLLKWDDLEKCNE